MKWDLSKVGIKKDIQYECIATTVSEDGVKNAEVNSFRFLGDDRVLCSILEGSKTLENIKNTNEYVANITQDSLVFTYATLDCLGDEYFSDETDIAIIKNTPAYIIVDVENIEKKMSSDGPDNENKNIYFITGRISQFKVNDKNARAFNRGLSALIEGLVNFSRYKLVDDDKRKEYMSWLDENQRVINNVSDEKTKNAMAVLKAEYDKN